MSSPLSELEIIADLRCELDGSPVMIRTEDRKIIVEVPSLATGLKVIRLGSPRGCFSSSARKLKQLLDEMASSIEMRVDGEKVGRMGYEVGSFWWRLFGLPPISFHPLKVFALARRGR